MFKLISPYIVFFLNIVIVIALVKLVELFRNKQKSGVERNVARIIFTSALTILAILDAIFVWKVAYIMFG